MKSKLAILAIVVLLSGCSGAMNGMIRDTGERVSITYEQGMSSDSLVITLPDGEIFKGRAVRVGSSTGIVSGFGAASAYGSGGNSAYGTSSSFGVVSTHTGNLQATLFGDRKHTMRCSFQYADTSGYTPEGGIGVCETSDGRVIDVQW